MTDKFYELSHNFDRFDKDDGHDEHNDGYLEKFEGYEELDYAFFHCAAITLGVNKGIAEREPNKEGIWRVLKAQMPKEIEFTADREWLSMTDFPHLGDADFWPIMSRKMVEIILSVGDFPHQIIPVTFRDYLGIPIECDYVILQLNKLSHFLDMDKSLYTLTEMVDDPTKLLVQDIKKLMLKEPENGFPPIFRVEWKAVNLFVSAEAKIALEAAGIKGTGFSAIRQIYLMQTYYQP
jgi:hypothetical protein